MTDEIARPVMRSDCRDAVRPCAFLACKHHMISAFSKPQLYGLDDDELLHFALGLSFTCVLDFVDAHPGGSTLQDIADVLFMTRERARQLIDHQKAIKGRNHGAVDRCRHPSRLVYLQDFRPPDYKLWEGNSYHANISEIYG